MQLKPKIADHSQIQLREIFCQTTQKEQDQLNTNRDPRLHNGEESQYKTGESEGNQIAQSRKEDEKSIL